VIHLIKLKTKLNAAANNDLASITHSPHEHRRSWCRLSRAPQP
jgi:hypothetical protein